MIKGLTKTIEYKRHWSDLTTRDVLVPGSGLQASFEHEVKPFWQQIELLGRARDVLSRARDLLIPRLISGKLKVDHLDIRMPPAMREAAEAASA